MEGEAVSVLVGEATHETSEAVAGEGTVGLDVVLHGVRLTENLAANAALPTAGAAPQSYDVIDTIVIRAIVKHSYTQRQACYTRGAQITKPLQLKFHNSVL